MESEKTTFFQQLSISVIFSKVRKVVKLQFLGLNKGIIVSVIKNKNKNFQNNAKYECDMTETTCDVTEPGDFQVMKSCFFHQKPNFCHIIQ